MDFMVASFIAEAGYPNSGSKEGKAKADRIMGELPLNFYANTCA